MMQLLITPQAYYKWMRTLVIGYDSAGAEADGHYVIPAVKGPITALSYFKLGTGAPTDIDGNVIELTETWLRTNVLDAASGKGDVHVALKLSGSPDVFYKALTADNFYNYGNSASSKVVGVLSSGSITTVEDKDKHWNMPGVLFQVGCHITSAEGNFKPDGSALGTGEKALVNELGLYDEDDVLLAYAIFTTQEKDDSTSLKVNAIAMMKALDYLIS